MASSQPGTRDATESRIIRLFSAPFASMAVSLGAVRARATNSMSTLVLSTTLLLAGIAVGALISTNWQAQPSAVPSTSSPITRQSGREIVASTIQRLESEQAGLKKQIADLRARLTAAQNGDAQRKSTLSELNNEIAQQRIAAGMVAVHGPGIKATFDDSSVADIPSNEDPAKYILHDYDLRDVVNALRISGAEAISINGERIIGTTSLYCVGTTIICNVTRLSPPYEVRAIGDPAALESALKGSTQMEKFNQRAEIYDLPVKIEQNQDILVPAYNGSLVFKYTGVADGK